MNVLIQDCTLAYNQNGLFVNNDIAGLVVKRNELIKTLSLVLMYLLSK